MSKKNRRKTLSKKESIITTSEFSMDDSKIYLLLTLIVFHIVPLIFIMMGENGKLMLAFMYPTVNPIFLGIAGLIYGMKEGFNFKFPGVMFILATLSVIMYGQFEPEMAVITPVVLGIIYLLFSYLSTVIGGLLGKLFRI